MPGLDQCTDEVHRMRSFVTNNLDCADEHLKENLEKHLVMFGDDTNLKILFEADSKIQQMLSENGDYTHGKWKQEIEAIQKAWLELKQFSTILYEAFGKRCPSSPYLDRAYEIVYETIEPYLTHEQEEQLSLYN